MTRHPKGPREQRTQKSESSPSHASDEEAVNAFITAINLESPGLKTSRPAASSAEAFDSSLIQISAQILRHTLTGQAQKIKKRPACTGPEQLFPLAERMLRLDEALTDLSQYDPDKTRMVELCYFAGMQKQDVARVLGWSEERFQREWLFTKAWLKRHMSNR